MRQREERGLPGTPNLGGAAFEVPRIDVEPLAVLGVEASVPSPTPYPLFSIFLYFPIAGWRSRPSTLTTSPTSTTHGRPSQPPSTPSASMSVTKRVFDQQDWSNTFNCWVSRPGSAARSRTMFREGEYVKSDAAPLRRLS